MQLTASSVEETMIGKCPLRIAEGSRKLLERVDKDILRTQPRDKELLEPDLLKILKKFLACIS